MRRSSNLLRRRAIADWPALLTIALIVALVVLIQWLPSVGRRSEGDRPTRVEAWGWNSPGAAMHDLAPRFEAQHPGVDVDVKISGTMMQSRFLLAMASGRGAPDVMTLQEREAGQYTATGRLADLTPWAAKYANDFPQSFWQTCTIDGRVYAVPWDIAPVAVFYKRWVFAKYGIDPESIQTWDDLIAAGRTIVERSNRQTKMMPLTPALLGTFFQVLMQQNGGGVFDARGRVILDSPKNREVLDLIRRLLDSGIGSPINTAQEANVSYTNDSIACYPSAVWNMADVKQSGANHAGEWGVFRLPAVTSGGLRNSNQGGSVLVVPAQSPVAPSAEQFVEFTLCRVDSAIESYEKWALFPAFLPAQRDPRFDTADPFFGGQHVAKLFAQDFERVPGLVRTRDWPEAENFINRTLYDWARERQDSGEYLKQTARALAARLDREVAE